MNIHEHLHVCCFSLNLHAIKNISENPIKATPTHLGRRLRCTLRSALAAFALYFAETGCQTGDLLGRGVSFKGLTLETKKCNTYTNPAFGYSFYNPFRHDDWSVSSIKSSLFSWWCAPKQRFGLRSIGSLSHSTSLALRYNSSPCALMSEGPSTYIPVVVLCAFCSPSLVCEMKVLNQLQLLGRAHLSTWKSEIQAHSSKVFIIFKEKNKKKTSGFSGPQL